ncbi:ArgS-related anticodon-binding protein NrtL [Streptomyces sp. NPDC006368]|uniref:ArgS-related anticodon-binding protein NrtL n=1 Tax=Streptomyces sp. NPDC006368 TaxID=3156760 RepID=UPI0033AD82C5
MTPADLSLTVLHAVRRAVGEGALRAESYVPERVKVERPRGGGRGDYASNAALQLAGPAALPARRVAEILRDRLTGAPGIEAVEITGPGFLNFTLRAGTSRELVGRVLEQGRRYGHGSALAGQVLHYHHRREVRAAVMADALRRLLHAQGAHVRVSCDRPDPAWAALGVTVEPEAGADPGPPPAPGPLPAPGRLPGTDPRGVSCDRPDPAWAALGVTVDAHGAPPADSAAVTPRPVTYDVHPLGRDAARWALLRPAGRDRVLDGDGLLTQTEANGLFTVRYAHARTRALLRNAAQLGITPAYEQDVDAPRLLTALGDHPAVLEAAARHRAPDRVARHLEATADAFLGFQHTVLPLGDEKPSAAHRSRLALAEAAGTVLAGGLALLGISAPDYL